MKNQYKKIIKDIKKVSWEILWGKIEQFTKNPTGKIIEILGATASGKSHLAVEIALKLKKKNLAKWQLIIYRSKRLQQFG